jgi:hypothetical protein
LLTNPYLDTQTVLQVYTGPEDLQLAAAVRRCYSSLLFATDLLTSIFILHSSCIRLASLFLASISSFICYSSLPGNRFHGLDDLQSGISDQDSKMKLAMILWHMEVRLSGLFACIPSMHRCSNASTFELQRLTSFL